MRIQSQNRLAHYQCEYAEVSEQILMQQNQLPGLQNQIASLQQYLNCNNGDRKARSDYSKLVQRYNGICGNIKRNQMRLQTLFRQICAEKQKIEFQQQKQMMSANRGNNRYGY